MKSEGHIYGHLTYVTVFKAFKIFKQMNSGQLINLNYIYIYTCIYIYVFKNQLPIDRLIN